MSFQKQHKMQVQLLAPVGPGFYTKNRVAMISRLDEYNFRIAAQPIQRVRQLPDAQIALDTELGAFIISADDWAVAQQLPTRQRKTSQSRSLPIYPLAIEPNADYMSIREQPLPQSAHDDPQLLIWHWHDQIITIRPRQGVWLLIIDQVDRPDGTTGLITHLGTWVVSNADRDVIAVAPPHGYIGKDTRTALAEQIERALLRDAGLGPPARHLLVALGYVLDEDGRVREVPGNYTYAPPDNTPKPGRQSKTEKRVRKWLRSNLPLYKVYPSGIIDYKRACADARRAIGCAWVLEEWAVDAAVQIEMIREDEVPEWYGTGEAGSDDDPQ